MSGARVTGGEAGGRRLAVPAGTRPTGGRVREALFSIWGARVAGAPFADLFAGSGAVGIEALSRGATRALFVEWRRPALRILERNLELLGLEGRSEVRRAQLPGGLGGVGQGWRGAAELVFADPPYGFRDAAGLLREATGLLAPAGELALEHAARGEVPERVGELALLERRNWGESAVGFYGRRGE